MKKALAIFLIIVILGLMVIALVPEVNAIVINGLKEFGGGMLSGAIASWQSMVMQPWYQASHGLIWFVGGIVFLGSLILLKRKGKIPGMRGSKADQTQTQPMGAPQTVIIREVPAPTSAAPPQVAPQPVNPQVNKPVEDAPKSSG